MLLQVHDELLFEAPEAEVEKTTQVVRSVMEGALHGALRTLSAARRRNRLGTELRRGALAFNGPARRA